MVGRVCGMRCGRKTGPTKGVASLLEIFKKGGSHTGSPPLGRRLLVGGHGDGRGVQAACVEEEGQLGGKEGCAGSRQRREEGRRRYGQDGQSCGEDGAGRRGGRTSWSSPAVTHRGGPLQTLHSPEQLCRARGRSVAAASHANAPSFQKLRQLACGISMSRAHPQAPIAQHKRAYRRSWCRTGNNKASKICSSNSSSNSSTQHPHGAHGRGVD